MSAKPAPTLPDPAPLPRDPAPLRAAVLDWFDVQGRELPFRGTTDPWAVLVSEAMAQQTQVARAGESWRGFMVRFPTPASLAAASPADVLRAWRGLGYNRRAVALQRAAQAIVADHDGSVPSDLAALERLPGVGPYTARAVAAFALGHCVAPVDTNVRRVLGRVAGAGQAVPPPQMQALADELVDPLRPGDWTHALMDVGATLCRPIGPDCEPCPLRRWCRHTASGRASATSPRPRGAREPAAPFETTSRWLRGRIVERLRDADDGAWVALDGSLGVHDAHAVAEAFDSLARDGLIERHPSDGTLVRLPTKSAPAGRPDRPTGYPVRR